MGPEKESEFKRIALKNRGTAEHTLPDSEKQRMINIINYVQELMKKNIRETENQ